MIRGPGFFFLDSSDVNSRWSQQSIMGRDPVKIIEPKSFEELEKYAEKGVLVGGLSPIILGRTILRLLVGLRSIFGRGMFIRLIFRIGFLGIFLGMLGLCT